MQKRSATGRLESLLRGCLSLGACAVFGSFQPSAAVSSYQLHPCRDGHRRYDDITGDNQLIRQDYSQDYSIAREPSVDLTSAKEGSDAFLDYDQPRTVVPVPVST